MESQRNGLRRFSLSWLRKFLQNLDSKRDSPKLNSKSLALEVTHPLFQLLHYIPARLLNEYGKELTRDELKLIVFVSWKTRSTVPSTWIMESEIFGSDWMRRSKIPHVLGSLVNKRILVKEEITLEGMASGGTRYGINPMYLKVSVK